MELLIKSKINKYNRKIYDYDYDYDGNEIKLYYLINNIVYLKNQHKLLRADKHVLFTLLYRRLCQYYKKELYYIYEDWRDYSYNIYNNKKYMLYSNKYIINLEYLYVVNSKNRLIIPKTYYNSIYSICGEKIKNGCESESESESEGESDSESDEGNI